MERVQIGQKRSIRYGFFKGETDVKKRTRISASGRNTQPASDLKYLRPAQVPRRYPFSRSILYELLGAGKIKSISVRKPGGVRGIRLVSVASIEDFLAKLVASKGREVMPVVTREHTEKKIAKRRKVDKRAPRGGPREPSHRTSDRPEEEGPRRAPIKGAPGSEDRLSVSYALCRINASNLH